MALSLVFAMSAASRGSGSKAEAVAGPEASTVEMAKLLEELRAPEKRAENLWDSARQAEVLIEAGLPSDPRKRWPYRVRLSRELLRAGRTEDAIQLLEGMVRAMVENRIDPASVAEARLNLAMAYLRLGEQQNCVHHHSTEACLLPIRGTGVHHETAGSRAAVKNLEAALAGGLESQSQLTARWLLNIAYQTLGEYPEKVPAPWLIPPQAYQGEDSIPRFPNVASELGLDTLGTAGGVVLDDLDQDGDIDVLVSSWTLDDQLRLFLNLGDGHFAEHTEEAGLEGITAGLNMLQADYDNDGRVDVFLLRGAWLQEAGRHPNSLLKNLGGGRFADVTKAAGLLDFHPTQTAAWSDFDLDGDVDLFVGNETRGQEPSGRLSQSGLIRGNGTVNISKLFRNRGVGKDGQVAFDEVGGDLGLDIVGFVKAVVWGDYDNDGWPDLYVSRWGQPNLLMRNSGPEGDFRFLDVTEQAGVAGPQFSFPAWFFDYDNDGWLDLWVSGYGPNLDSAPHVAADVLGLPGRGVPPKLYRNRGGGTFEDVTTEVGLDTVLFTMGANFGDLDNDGFLDFYAGTGAPRLTALVPNRMFHNIGGRRFADVTTSGGFGHLQKGHAIAFADLEGDGDQDILAVMGGAYSGDVYQNAVFENPGNAHRWVVLRLEGERSNRSAIGARVRLVLDRADGIRELHRVVGTGGSFGGSSLQLEVGLGDASAIRRVEIRWPIVDGDVQVLTGIEPGGVWVIREGEAEARLVGSAGSAAPTETPR